MCGIYGIIGKCKNALNNAINALYNLEYRGYDSSGLSYLDSKGQIITIKSTGKIDNLKKHIENVKENPTCLICHTRWATHGKVSINNTHPHTTNNVAIVHNGIITNYEKIKSKLKNFYNFYGECDSEVIAKLIDYNLTKTQNPLLAFSKAVKELEGSFAIECIIKNNFNTILIAKKESPMYICKNDKNLIISSDLITFPSNTNEYYEIGELEICELKNKTIKFYNLNLKEKTKKPSKFDVKQNKIQLENYSHFMLKEINDIPKALNATLKNFTLNDKFNCILNNIKHVHLIACGTAYHSACMGAFIIQSLTSIPAYSFIASDWIDLPNSTFKDTLYVFISQSGETFDTISALKKAKLNNCTTLTITNTTYSTLANLSDYVLPIMAGKEVAVASTKVYNACNLACIYLANKLKNNQETTYKIDINYNEINKLLTSNFEEEFSKILIKFKKVFLIGKCEDYITSMEASLKIKEITYINCCAIPAGELKHGTLALIDNKTLIIAHLTNPNYKDKILSAISEVKARGAKVLLVSSISCKNKDIDYFYKLPNDSKLSLLLYSIIPMQKLAYYTSILLGKNPDKPRNLAKSVTVA